MPCSNEWDIDIEIPVMDGIKLTKKIQRRGWTKEMLPILGITAGIQQKGHQEAIISAMNDWLYQANTNE